MATVHDSLDALKTALEDENYEQIDTELDAYEAAYERRVSDERLTLQRSQFGRLQLETTSETESTLATYENQFGGTNASRVGLLTGGELFLLNPQKSDPSELIDGVGTLREQENTLSENRTAADEALSDMDLPARVAVLSVTPESHGVVLGSTVPVEITIADFGDTPARDVSLSVESDLQISPTEATVGSIASGDVKTITVHVTATETGTHDLLVSIEGANAGSTSRSADFSIISGDELVSTASGYIAELIERFKNTSSLPGNKEHSFVVKLQHARQHIDQAQQAVDDGNEKKADNELKTAINQMGAFLNEVATLDKHHGHGKKHGHGRGKGHSSPSAAFVQSVRREGQVVVNQLARTRTSSLTE